MKARTKRPFVIAVDGDRHREHILVPAGRPKDINGTWHSLHDFTVPSGADSLRELLNAACPRTCRIARPRLRLPAKPMAVTELEPFTLESPGAPSQPRWQIRRVHGWVEGAEVSKQPVLAKRGKLPQLLVLYDRATGAHTALVAQFLSPKIADPRILLLQCRFPKEPKAVLASVREPSARASVVTVVHADSLRDARRDPSPGISSLSHERAVLHLLRSLNRPADDGAALSSLFAGVNHLIVILAPSAIARCDRGDKEWTAALTYHDQRLYDARRPLEDKAGQTSLVTTSVAAALATPNQSLSQAIADGCAKALVLLRRYQVNGLQVLARKDFPRAANVWSEDLMAPFSPDEQTDFERVAHRPNVMGTGWSVLLSRCDEEGRKKHPASASSAIAEGAAIVATDIARKGLTKAQQAHHFPIAKFGDWVGVDLAEIEGYQSLRRLMRKYILERGWNKPLSLAAFGPPGSGKSFGIVQVAADLGARNVKIPEKHILKFNLGGFTSVADLTRALHASRDITLGGAIPLVVLDEFDAVFEGRPHGWFKYLLAPTQDGKFRDGASEYHVGNAIFIFVGGVSPTFDDLAGQMRSREFIEAKGPDFVSRLRGHVNVRGPNQVDALDHFYMIRRAVLFRSIVDRVSKGVKIHPAVVDAFLQVKEFRHGVRSMEAIVEMSDFSEPRGQFMESSLPPRDQLNMHTDAFDFLERIRQPRRTT